MTPIGQKLKLYVLIRNSWKFAICGGLWRLTTNCEEYLNFFYKSIIKLFLLQKYFSHECHMCWDFCYKRLWKIRQNWSLLYQHDEEYVDFWCNFDTFQSIYTFSSIWFLHCCNMSNCCELYLALFCMREM